MWGTTDTLAYPAGKVGRTRGRLKENDVETTRTPEDVAFIKAMQMTKEEQRHQFSRTWAVMAMKVSAIWVSFAAFYNLLWACHDIAVLLIKG